MRVAAIEARAEGRRAVSQSWGRPLRLSPADIVPWRAQLLLTGTCHVWMGAVGSDGYGRIAIRNREDGPRTLTPHQIGARLGFGPIPAGATVLHDCESGYAGAPSRVICGSAPRARTCGRRWPGATRSDPTRGGSTSAARSGRPGPSRPRYGTRPTPSPDALAAVLAAVIADGDPLRDTTGVTRRSGGDPHGVAAPPKAPLFISSAPVQT
jgi:hypothetical protein